MLRRHADRIEHHLRGRLRMPAELAFLRAEADAGHVLFDHQARNALRPLLTGADHDDIEIVLAAARDELLGRSEEHTSELQSLMRNAYTVLCLEKKTLT